MIPAWLQTHLETTGAWNADGINRGARAQLCPTCRQVTLVGLDADRAALTAATDPEPLNPLGEYLAVATGRRTYDLTWTRGTRYELNPRDAAHIQKRPAQLSGKSTVVAEHVCGQPMPLEGRIDQPPEPVPNGKVPF